MAGTTITQVAKQAGVSPSTVSYVLSGNRPISEATRARVRRAIEELNYKPHGGRRALIAAKTDVVALVVPFYDWRSEAVIMPFVYGVADESRRHGWDVMLVTSPDGGPELGSVVTSKMVDRVVLMEIRVNDERVRVIEQLGTPAVLLGMPMEPVRVPFVDFDFDAAGRLCVEYLTSLGHRHIGLLASPAGVFDKNLGYARRFWDGVASSVKGAGLVFHGVPLELNSRGVDEALDYLFDEEPGLTGLIIHNEPMTDRLIPALQKRGMAVPADVSVVAVGPYQLTKRLEPRLTYIDVPSVDMGRAAVRELAEGGPGKLLPPSLVAGGTAAPPPAA